MKKFFLMVAFACSTLAMQAQHLGSEYRLKKVMTVEGRQGIAADEEFYYISSSTDLYKYDKSGKLVAKSVKPFAKLKLAANHFGDIDVYNGEIFTGIETFVDGVGKNIQVAVYDAKTLEFKYSIPWDAESGQVEVSGLTVDRERNQVWMSDWVKGRWLYCYDLATKKFVRKVHLRPDPQWQQGIFCVDGKMLISADDGDADFGETDNVYVCDIADTHATTAYTSLFREMKEFKRAGEIEGLCVDPTNDDFLVLMNRGSRIILGMVKGFYPGYDKEIHELYIYEKVK